MIDGKKSAGFEELEVWQKATDFAEAIYKTTKAFPREEQYGLTAQIRRAAVSIVSNIAEGSARGNDGDFARFLCMAAGSCAEVKAQLMLAVRLGFLKEEESIVLLQYVNTIGKMLKGLERSIRNRKNISGAAA